MIARLRKSLGTIFLSVLLVNSGVGWAVDDCSWDGERIGHEHVSHEEPLVGVAEASDAALTPLSVPQPETTRLHCLSSHYATGLDAVAATAFRLENPKKGIAFKTSHSCGLVSSSEANTFLAPLFRWLSSSSPPDSFSRYLLLSVLRI